MPLLLHGEAASPEVTRLKREIVGLEQELEETREEVQKYKNASSDAVKAISALRKVLDPLHTAMKMIYGEINRVEIPRDPFDLHNEPIVDKRWESWKQKLPGKPAEFIQILLEHGEMSGAQLKAAAHCAQQTVYDTIAKLKAAGLVTKNGKGFALKPLS